MVECAAYGGVGDNLPLDTKVRSYHPFANAIKKSSRMACSAAAIFYSSNTVEELQLSSNWL